MYEGKKSQGLDNKAKKKNDIAAAVNARALTEEETARVTGGVDVDAPDFFNDQTLIQDPGKETFYFLADGEVHYDQIVLEDLYKVINGEEMNHE